ncbi:hypothetical protein V6Z12_A05G333900 [Gossypium hirsutum]
MVLNYLNHFWVLYILHNILVATVKCTNKYLEVLNATLRVQVLTSFREAVKEIWKLGAGCIHLLLYPVSDERRTILVCNC